MCTKAKGRVLVPGLFLFIVNWTTALYCEPRDTLAAAVSGWPAEAGFGLTSVCP